MQLRTTGMPRKEQEEQSAYEPVAPHEQPRAGGALAAGRQRGIMASTIRRRSKLGPAWRGSSETGQIDAEIDDIDDIDVDLP